MANVMYSGKMISDQIDAYLTNAVAAEGVKDGSLVVLGDLAADTTYDANGLEYDLYEAAKPAAATDEVVLIDYAGISEGIINGNDYKMGHRLYDLEAPAGTPMRARRLGLHDKFWLGEGNFDTAPTVGEFAGINAGAYTHKALAALPASGYGVKILVEKDLTTGTRSNGKIYLVEVVQL